MIGRTIGNYRVTAQLGEGGMGVVYLAEHPVIGKKVAIKLLHPEMAKNPEAVTRFFNEARAVNAIAHENIVDIGDLGQTAEGETYFVMELLDGESLSSRLRRETLAPGEACDVAMQIASACDGAHKRGIIHRDLKPDNVYLCPRGGRANFVKVLDFGIAKLTGGDSVATHKTRTGMVIGTPAYMSPEQCSGKGDLDGRSDQYSLGMILFEMVTGRVAFVEESFTGTLLAHLTQPVPPPTVFNSDVPPELEQVILKCLEKDRANRFGSMEALIAAIAPMATIPAPRPAPTPPPVSEPLPPKTPTTPTTLRESAGEVEEDVEQAALPRSRAPIFVGAVLVLALAGGGAYFALGRAHAPAPPPAVAAAPAPAPLPPPQLLSATVKVHVESTPTGAHVFRAATGVELGVSPLDLPLDRSAQPVEVVVRADGFAEGRVSVVPDHDKTVAVALLAAPKPAEPASAPASGKSAPTHHKKAEPGKDQFGGTGVDSDY